MTHCYLKSGFWVGNWCQHKRNQHWNDCLRICSLWSAGLIWLLFSQVNFHSIFQFLHFPVNYSLVTKCCKAYYHRVASSANTLCTINVGIWDINTCLTKQALNYFQDFVAGFILLFLYVFNSQTEASTILLIFFAILFYIVSTFLSFFLKIQVFLFQVCHVLLKHCCNWTNLF